MSRYRWTILAAGVVAQASYTAIPIGLPAIAPELQDQYKLSLTQVGVVLAAVNVGSLATLLLWGLAADRIGERAVLVVGLLGTAAALVVAGLTTSYIGLIATLALAGALGAGTNTASGRAVMGWFGPEERGLALGIRQTANPLGGAIAAIVLPLLATHVSVRSSFFGLAVGCAGAALVSGALLRRDATSIDHADVRRPLRDARIWRICIGSTFYVLTQLSLISFLVLFLHAHRGLSTAAGAAVLALTQVLAAVARIVIGGWSDRIGARIRPLLQLGLALAGSVALTALLVDASEWLLLPALVVAGTLGFCWNGLSFTAAAEAAGPVRAGAALGLQQSFLAAGSIVAPILFAAIVHEVSWRVAFAATAVSPLIGYAVFSPLSERRS
ncbi:MAG TPA: MFS transporter [Gaiellaceae bacterium]|nr:MFS transporter [Gaiellaceae bacterium]